MLISRKSKLKAGVAVSLFLIAFLTLAVHFHYHQDNLFDSECPICASGSHVLLAEGPFDFASTVPLVIRPIVLFLTDLHPHQAFLSFPFERAPPPLLVF